MDEYRPDFVVRTACCGQEWIGGVWGSDKVMVQDRSEERSCEKYFLNN